MRVVREDPVVQGLLYAGTEKGMFISFDDGREWQPFDLNLPAVPITDLRAREDGLAVATQGRAFWILDDLWTVRQASNELADKALHLYTPPTWAMGKPGSRPGRFEGANPSPNVPLYYVIRDEVDEDAELSIEIFDASGALVRSMSSKESDQERCEKGNEDPRRPITHSYAPVVQGFNKWSWNLNSEDVTCIDNILLHGGYNGPTVAPGEYTARLTLGDATSEASFTVLKDPRSFATDAQIADWAKTLLDVKGLLANALQKLNDARTARQQIGDMMAANSDAELQSLGEQAIAEIDGWEDKVTQLKHETFEDEDAWPNMIDGQIRHLMDVMDNSGAPVTGGMRIRQADLTERWNGLEAELREITQQRIEPINRWARERNEPHVVRPAANGR